MRLSNPRRLKLRSIGNDQQAREEFLFVRPSDQTLQGSSGRVQCTSSKIISTGLYRDNASTCASERFQRSLPTLLRGQFERRITSIIRQRQHFGK